jgi:hypothetical protein
MFNNKKADLKMYAAHMLEPVCDGTAKIHIAFVNRNVKEKQLPTI